MSQIPKALMEVEVKLRLLDAAAHRQVTTLLAPFLVATHRQENFFFDGSKAELSARLAVLRLRFSDRSPLCAVTLKARAVLVDGISRVEEDEEELDHSIGRACVAEPDKLMAAESRVLRRVREEFGVLGFVGLGGFRNVRDVYDWKGLKLEVDETKYDFGTCYEIECESSDPEGVKVVLEDFLKENGVRYSYSEVSKFATFRAGKLPVIQRSAIGVSVGRNSAMNRRMRTSPNPRDHCTLLLFRTSSSHSIVIELRYFLNARTSVNSIVCNKLH
ncbi:hypothetical protein FF1_026028 [Malus domestica]